MLIWLLQVAERALFLWNNDHIRNLIIQNRKVILPIIFPPLERNTRGHWNQAVQSLTLNVRKIFSDADQSLFDECLVKYQEDEVKEKENNKKRESTWIRLENETELVSKFASLTTASSWCGLTSIVYNKFILEGVQVVQWQRASKYLEPQYLLLMLVYSGEEKSSHSIVVFRRNHWL